MTRQTAYQMLTKYLTNPTLLKHSLATEATMRALAPRFGGDMEEWGITGLLHDADYEKAKGHPEEHGLLLFKLEPNAVPSPIERAINAHNYEYTKVIPESKMDWAIVCCDELTALITQLLQDKKITTLTPQVIVDKLMQKDFMKEVKKEHIFFCQEKLGITLLDFVAITLSAIQGIHSELGL